MIKTYLLADGKLSESSSDNAQVRVFINPDENEKAHLVRQIGLDEHTLNSALDPDELGRIEFEDSHMAAIIKRPKRYSAGDNYHFKVHSLGLFLFPDRLYIVALEDAIFGEGKTYTKMQTMRDVFLRVIFHCILHFEEHLRIIRKVSDELELEINQAFSNKDLLNMFKLEKSLVYYLDAVNSNNKVIEKLRLSSAKLGFPPEVNEFLDDLMIEGNQCFQQANSYSEVLASMMDAWASIINNNLNIRLKTLTILSLCVMTPTMVVSLFSMNVPLPLPHTILSFWIVMALAVLSVVAIWLVWRYKKW